MTTIHETPLKRRKSPVSRSTSAAGAKNSYDSDNDSGSILFDGYSSPEEATVATVAVAPPATRRHLFGATRGAKRDSEPMSSLRPYSLPQDMRQDIRSSATQLTEPTQLIDLSADSTDESGDKGADAGRDKMDVDVGVDVPCSPSPGKGLNRNIMLGDREKQSAKVQVPASSPLSATAAARSLASRTETGAGNREDGSSSPLGAQLTKAKPGGPAAANFASRFAPPGTVFRMPPAAPPPKKPEIMDISDDEEEIRYKGSSSDDDNTQLRNRDIKPSTVADRRTSNSRSTGTIDSQDRFKSTIAGFAYNGGSGNNANPKLSAAQSSFQGSVFDPRNRNEDHTRSLVATNVPPKRPPPGSLASAYGESPVRKKTKTQQQSGPSRAMPVVDDTLVMEDIPDFLMRKKIERVRMVMPQCSIGLVHATLMAKRGSEQDAMDTLAEMEDSPAEVESPVLVRTKNDGPKGASGSFLELTGEGYSDEENGASFTQLASKKAQHKLPPPKPKAKQQLKAPAQSLAAKYKAQKDASSSEAARRGDGDGDVQLPKLPPQNADKPKRKLVRGRKNPSSPVRPRSSSPAGIVEKSKKKGGRVQSPELIESDDDENDSAIGSSETAKADFSGNLLNFFNTCSVADLADIASITEDVAKWVVDKKPFRTLAQIRRVVAPEQEESAAGTKKKAKRGNAKRPIGEKIVDVCEKMWAGYEAIDQLVQRCQEISQPVAQEMKKWGVDVYGGSTNGELDVVDIGGTDGTSDGNPHDSGIATPKSSLSGEDDVDGGVKSSARNRMLSQPKVMSDKITLKDYQVVGLNWLALLYNYGLSCILADDMGLGKTCQVISFLAHLYEQGEQGPHIIVVPSSVIENWLREFKRFCPRLRVAPYHGKQDERALMAEEMEDKPPNVVITTYTIAKKKDDLKFLRRLKPVVCVYDEGHALKNQESNAYVQLMKIRAEFRLLLTGTPLQNNLGELAALLRFILPDVFRDHEEDLEAIFSHKATTQNHTHEALLSDQRVSKAKSMLAPFILRRKKHQVLKHLPPKTRRVEYCGMTDWQKHVYDSEWERSVRALQGRSKGEKGAEKPYNIQMALRKAAMHPLLHRYRYDDDKLREMSETYASADVTAPADVNPNLVFEDLSFNSDFGMLAECERYKSLRKYKLDGEPWMDSGKVEKLVELLLEYKAAGDRVLVFSQMTMVLDILEEVLNTVDVKFCRLDGDTKVEQRQELIDLFYQDESITAFLVSTKAGGAGINLAAANRVIIFDSGYNPQDDVQAENRAHRVGQTRPVEVVRLVTEGTIEEAIFRLGETKLALDQKIAGDDGGELAASAAAAGEDEKAGRKIEESGVKEVERMLREQMEEKTKVKVKESGKASGK